MVGGDGMRTKLGGNRVESSTLFTSIVKENSLNFSCSEGFERRKTSFVIVRMNLHVEAKQSSALR